jgi:hypothetical protein
MLLNACSPQSQHHGRPVAVEAVDDISRRLSILLRHGGVTYNLLEEVGLPII